MTALSDKMSAGEPPEIIERMDFVRNRLVELYKRNLVKINHSTMELVCAKHLIRYGYSVDVEKQLTDILVCDVYAEKGEGVAIVEIETGFIPPEHALDPLGFLGAGETVRDEHDHALTVAIGGHRPAPALAAPDFDDRLTRPGHYRLARPRFGFTLRR